MRTSDGRICCGRVGGDVGEEEEKKGRIKMESKKKRLWKMWGILCLLICFLAMGKPGRASAETGETDFTGWTPISTAEELQKMNHSTQDSRYYLTKDIDLKTFGYWEGITDFIGTFDGNGHCIKNLTSLTYGLFVNLRPGAVVRNLRLLDVNISSVESDVGGIAGCTGYIDGVDNDKIGTAVQISNCIVTGTVVKSGSGNVGGIMGSTDNVSVMIDSCITEAELSADYDCGGTIGDISENVPDTVISNCCCLQGTYSGHWQGAIVGDISEGTIRNCYTNVNTPFVYSAGTNVKIFSSYYFVNEEDGDGSINGLFKPVYLDSSAKLKQSSYEGWDFSKVWTLNKGINDGYPILKWYIPYMPIQTPYANMKSGTYGKGFKIELGSDVEGAKIYYTTDGSNPTPHSKLYSGSISINRNLTVKALAVYDEVCKSRVGSYTYKVRCAEPKANYKSGKKFKSSVKITLSTKEPGASIYYTTNGKTPTAKSKLYRKPITLRKSTILKVVVVKNGKANSKAVSWKYYIKK